MKRTCLVTLLSLLTFPASAREKVSLISPSDPVKGWSFDNGQEFKGATGSLTNDESEKHQGNPSIHLQGNFTKGGMYVQTGLKFKPTDIEELSFWVKSPGSGNFTLRLIDSSGQCHQLKISTDPSGEWQHIIFPLKKFFANRGQSDAVQGVSQYQSWSGAKDGKWHGPAKALYILLGKGDEPGIRDLWLNDVTITPPVPEAPVTLVPTTVPLVGGDSEGNWTFTNGAEFKGATGTLVWENGDMILSGDFTNGGAYVASVNRLPGLNLESVSNFQLSYRSENASFIRIQLVDATGQTHQRKLTITADGKPHTLDIIPHENRRRRALGRREKRQMAQPAQAHFHRPQQRLRQGKGHPIPPRHLTHRRGRNGRPPRPRSLHRILRRRRLPLPLEGRGQRLPFR